MDAMKIRSYFQLDRSLLNFIKYFIFEFRIFQRNCSSLYYLEIYLQQLELFFCNRKKNEYSGRKENNFVQLKN